MSGTGGEAVTPELALVDPELAEAQRQTTERKAAMSSTEPSNGTFFVDQAQPAPTPAPTPEPSAAPIPQAEPVATPAPAPAPAPSPAASAAPAAVGQASTTTMLDVPLGTLIFRAGLLAEEQLEDALQEGMRSGKRLGEVLLERGWLQERDLGRLLAGQKGLPFVEVSASDVEPSALQVLPEEKARLQCTLPLRYEDGQLVIAVADPSNELLLENLRRTLGAEPRLVVATQGDLIRAIGEAYAQTPAPAPAPVAAPAPQPEPVPSLQPEPSLQVEPVEPVAAPAVTPTPMPTVLPPAEERSAEASEVPPLQPLVVEQAPTLEPPAAPVEEAPTPLLEPPATEPAVAPLLQPAEPAPEPPPAAASVAPPVETPQPPFLTPAVEQPVEVPPAPMLEQPVETPPATPEPEPTVEPETSSNLHIVLLHLRDGDMLEVGTFQTAADAAARAQEVVRQIAAAEGEATWPFFGERYLRPDTIVSVDLLEESAQKWTGSAVRNRWAHQQD